MMHPFNHNKDKNSDWDSAAVNNEIPPSVLINTFKMFRFLNFLVLIPYQKKVKRVMDSLSLFICELLLPG